MTTVVKPHSAYKPSGVSWLGDVPAHWEVRKLRSILAETTERNRPDWPLLSVVRERGVILRDLTDKDENHNYVPDDLTNYKVVHKGQFAMNKMKAWQGSYGVSMYDGIVSPAYYVFDIGEVEGDYFHRAIRSKSYVPFFGQASDGVRIGQWDLSKARMQEIPFPVPPVTEQRAIVRFLDYVDRRIRRYVAAKRKLIGLLEEENQAVVNRAVTQGLDPNVRLKPSGVEWLGDVPEHWETTRFSRQISIAKGQVDPTVEPYSSMSLIAPNHLEAKTGRLLHQETASEQGAISSKYLCRTGDVIYSKIRPALAKVVIAPSDCLCSADMYPLSPGDSLHANYLFWLLLSGAFTAWSVLESDRVAMPKINRATLNGYYIPMPPFSEQTAIVRHLDETARGIYAAIDNARRQIELVQEYRTKLIADVVTGKLDVREAAAQLPDEASDQNPIEESNQMADDLPGDLYDTDESVEDSALEQEVTP